MDRFTEESTADLERNFQFNRRADPEAFYTVSEPCEFCGRPLEDSICPCQLEEFPIEPRCPIEYRLVLAAEAVAALNWQVKIHRLTCPLCNRIRKQPGRAVKQPARKAA